ncbi:hypothetical protein AB9K26_14215 [Psychroserpens sp. XS_ASV72]|uniref:hypothetical protein n=1 Tax=Psychroserpens sp. XS_ASV72 TaxID=3241293 RepID=UPI00351759C6
MKWSQLKRPYKLGLFIVITLVVSAILLELFEKRFDQTDWANEPLQRYEMVDDLIESQLLKGKSKSEVISILGEPNSKAQTKEDVFSYDLGDPPSFFSSRKEFLVVVFFNHKVGKVSLAYE